jgi:formiminotetrahydrofolate cyclodeaminase
MKLNDFIEAVAAKTSTPGGGSVSAAASAMGVALGIMTARFSEGPKAQEIAGSLEQLKDRILPLIDRDAEAYSQVSKAYGLPKKSDEEKARRKEAVQIALKEAAEVPLEGMRLALEGLRTLPPLFEVANKNLISDFAGAVLMLEAGLAGCGLNVRINASLMTDKDRAARLEDDAGRLETEAGELKRRLLGAVHKLRAKA